MTYEEIRAARLQMPFRPFTLHMKSGDIYLIPEPARLAISRRILAFVNPQTGIIEESTPEAVESLDFVDDMKASPA